MAKWSNLAKRVPRFSVKQLLIAVTSLAVGLSNLDYFLPLVAACFLFIELLRQVRLLTALPSATEPTQRYGLKWASSARVLSAISLVALIPLELLVTFGVWSLPEREELLFVNVLPSDFLTLMIVIALALTCRGDSSRIGQHRVVKIIYGIGAILLLRYVAARGFVIPYLTHMATADVELDRPLRLRRHGVYPDHVAESYFTFRVGIAAALGVALAGLLLILISKNLRSRQPIPKRFIVAFVTLLSACIGYVVWYYGWEFHRISPDIASAGFAAVWVDCLGGMLIALTLITAVAAELSKVDSPPTSIEEHASTAAIQPGLFGLLAICTLLASLVGWIRGMITLCLDPPSWYVTNPLFDFVDIFLEPEVMLLLALHLFAAQIAWRWLRDGRPTICIVGMNPRAFALNWLALLALFGIGVPLLAAFGFSYWLGPWKPY